MALAPHVLGVASIIHAGHDNIDVTCISLSPRALEFGWFHSLNACGCRACSFDVHNPVYMLATFASHCSFEVVLVKTLATMYSLMRSFMI